MYQYTRQKTPYKVFGIFSIRTFFSLLILIVLALVLALIGNKTIGFFVVPTSSMEPTLIPGDKLVSVRKSVYDRGDIVALADPKEEGAFLAKRVVAVGGDTLTISPQGLKVNGTLIHEPYIKEAIEYDFGPYTCPENYVFILGDNRNKSDDSHLWGQGVPEETLIGQLRYIYGPSNRRGPLPESESVFVGLNYYSPNSAPTPK